MGVFVSSAAFVSSEVVHARGGVEMWRECVTTVPSPFFDVLSFYPTFTFSEAAYTMANISLLNSRVLKRKLLR